MPEIRGTGLDVRRLEGMVVLSVVVFAAGMAVAAVAAGGPGVWIHLSRLNLPLVAALLGLSLLNYVLRAVRWQIYGNHLGVPVPFPRTALYFTAGFALTTTPGKVGEALRLWLMERCHGYRYARTMPLFIADRVADLGAMGLLLMLSLASLSAGGWAGVWIAAAAAVVVSGMLLLGLRPRLALGGIGAAYRAVGRWPRLFGRTRSALRGTAELFAPRIMLVAMALTLAGWLAECTAFALILEALGADIGFKAAVFVFTASMLAGALSFLPGGLGGTEAAMLALLAAHGVGLDLAIPATAVVRVTTLWFAVALGFVALPPTLRLARRGAPA
ncbi:MAG TPA: lysylphosphatidylglycerol synthase transmembrane domain-containing protein [Azospirillaceae bacterium]|nr:lysylphosphatidylglycerol synthase transmembrane domain-containing protein [Azospirillaceae bacterium]